MNEATETDKAWCDALAQTLPTRSRRDTPATQNEIGDLYDFYRDVCPAQHAELFNE